MIISSGKNSTNTSYGGTGGTLFLLSLISCFLLQDYSFCRTRAEMPGGGRKPWTQKKSGRARHGSTRSPLWHCGGKAKGPRGPKSYFYLISPDMKSKGLKAVLSAKMAQDDLHIVDNFESLPSEDPKVLTEFLTT